MRPVMIARLNPRAPRERSAPCLEAPARVKAEGERTVCLKGPEALGPRLQQAAFESRAWMDPTGCPGREPGRPRQSAPRLDAKVPAGAEARASQVAELKSMVEALQQRVSEQLSGLDGRMQEKLGECEGMLRAIARAQAEAAEALPSRAGLAAAVSEFQEMSRELRPSPQTSRPGSASPVRRFAGAMRRGDPSGNREECRVGAPTHPREVPTAQGAQVMFAEEGEAWDLAEIQDLEEGSSDGTGPEIKITSSEEARARFRSRKRRVLKRLRGIVGDREERTIFGILSRSPKFNLLGMVMTVVNCVVIAVDADMNTTDALLDALAVEHADNSATKGALLNVQRVFFFWLLFEVLIHFLGNRIEYFVGSQKYWNCIDVTILITSVPQFMSGSYNLSFLRFLRLLRGARALQAVRFIRYSYSLQKMVSAFTSTVLTLFWAACMLFLIVYIFGLAMMEGVHSYVAAGLEPQATSAALGYEARTAFAGPQNAGLVQDLHSYYGGVGRTFVTLYRAISGADWSEFAAPLSLTGPLWGFVWMVYVYVVAFGCLNVITGMVVDILRQPMPTDRKFRMLVDAKEEKAVFEIFADELRARGKDVQETLLSKKFFDELTKRESIARQLRDFGIDINRWQDAFYLIDFENKGRVTAATVARRFLALRDEAKTQEVVRLAKDVVQLKRGLSEVAKVVLEIRERLPRPLGRSASDDIEEVDGNVTTVKA